jgi:uncharacterized membrane protein
MTSKDKSKGQKSSLSRWGIAALPTGMLAGGLIGAAFGNPLIGIMIGMGVGVGVAVSLLAANFVIRSLNW